MRQIINGKEGKRRTRSSNREKEGWGGKGSKKKMGGVDYLQKFGSGIAESQEG